MATRTQIGRKSIYLIQPKFPPSYWGQEHFLKMTPYGAVYPPLGLITLAALTPPEYDVTLCDENAGEKIDYDTDAEIVGITGYIFQREHVFEVADRFRRQGRTVVLGGPMANLVPEECRPHCDVLFEGEAEYTWPRFLREHAAGRHADHYQQAGENPPARLAPAPPRRPEEVVRPRHRAVHPRLPVHLRVLRHHRDVRPQDAVQADRAGDPGDRGLAGAGRGQGVLRRRQLHRQPRLRQGTAAGGRQVERPAAAAAGVLHPGEHRHGPRRGVARAAPRRQLLRGLPRHRDAAQGQPGRGRTRRRTRSSTWSRRSTRSSRTTCSSRPA